MVSVVIAAGGKGTRMGASFNKLFLTVCGKEIISRTIEVFDKCGDIAEIIVVAANNDAERIRNIIERDGFRKKIIITEGGSSRRSSVYNGLLRASGDIVLIHDGARCLVTEKDISAVIGDVKKYGAAAVGATVTDTLKTVDEDGRIVSTVDRDKTVRIYTPQGFMTEEIRDLHKRAAADGIEVTDDCSVFEHYGRTVHFTRGDSENIKVTTPEDIFFCENALKRRGQK